MFFILRAFILIGVFHSAEILGVLTKTANVSVGLDRLFQPGVGGFHADGLHSLSSKATDSLVRMVQQFCQCGQGCRADPYHCPRRCRSHIAILICRGQLQRWECRLGIRANLPEGMDGGFPHRRAWVPQRPGQRVNRLLGLPTHRAQGLCRYQTDLRSLVFEQRNQRRHCRLPKPGKAIART